MILDAQIIQSEGMPKFAVIDYKQYQAIQESLASFDSLDDFLDYVEAIKARQEINSWHSLDEVKRELGL